MSRQVLLVEDDPDIARLVRMHVEELGCHVEWAPDGAAALRLFAAHPFDLVILDLNLPDADGLALCRQMRQKVAYIPILMLTARSSEIERVVGLEMGADDYLTKPFSVVELLARIKALFRRVDALRQAQQASEPERIQIGELGLDVARRRVWVGETELELTAREFELLLYLARHPGRVFSRLQLLEAVWGYNHEGYEHTVNSHINRLRAKLEPIPSQPRYVVTVWGVGYKLAEPQA